MGTITFKAVDSQRRSFDAVRLLHVVGEMAVLGAAGQVAAGGRRIAVATGSGASGAGPLCAVVVRAAGTAARRLLHSRRVRGALRAVRVRVARVVAALLHGRLRGVRVVRGGPAAVRARSVRAQV